MTTLQPFSSDVVVTVRPPPLDREEAEAWLRPPELEVALTEDDADPRPELAALAWAGPPRRPLLRDVCTGGLTTRRPLGRMRTTSQSGSAATVTSRDAA